MHVPKRAMSWWWWWLRLSDKDADCWLLMMIEHCRWWNIDAAVNFDWLRARLSFSWGRAESLRFLSLHYDWFHIIMMMMKDITRLFLKHYWWHWWGPRDADGFISPFDADDDDADYDYELMPIMMAVNIIVFSASRCSRRWNIEDEFSCIDYEADVSIDCEGPIRLIIAIDYVKCRRLPPPYRWWFLRFHDWRRPSR